jgi:hypothetical protein
MYAHDHAFRRAFSFFDGSLVSVDGNPILLDKSFSLFDKLFSLRDEIWLNQGGFTNPGGYSASKV